MVLTDGSVSQTHTKTRSGIYSTNQSHPIIADGGNQLSPNIILYRAQHSYHLSGHLSCRHWANTELTDHLNYVVGLVGGNWEKGGKSREKRQCLQSYDWMWLVMID